MSEKEDLSKVAEFAKKIIRLHTDDKDLSPEDIIKKYQLYKPEEAIKFIIKIYFDSFESVIDEIGNIRLEILGDVVSYIDTAKKNLIYAYENPDYKDEKLRESHSDLTSVTSKLENRIRQYISELEKIDNRNGLSGLIFSPFDLVKVNKIIKMSKIAFTSYFEAIFLLTLIDNSRNANGSIFIRQSTKFINELKLNDDKKHIELFYNYDKDKSEIWNIRHMQGLIEKASSITESFEDYVSNINNDNKKYIECKE
ncbi:MAG: hypothetical protein HDT23_05285 [Ruminococcus sp.]|nr:hypothetical protein [Ruminococcus sp.]